MSFQVISGKIRSDQVRLMETCFFKSNLQSQFFNCSDILCWRYVKVAICYGHEKICKDSAVLWIWIWDLMIFLNPWIWIRDLDNPDLGSEIQIQDLTIYILKAR